MIHNHSLPFDDLAHSSLMKNTLKDLMIDDKLFKALILNNSPDNFLNGFTRLSGLTVPGSSYFFKVSSTPDFDNKILSTAESGFEAQTLLKFCPEYCSTKPKKIDEALS